MLREIDLPVATAAQLLYDLHHRHGTQAAEVINVHIKRHADGIRKGQIPPNSLLGMIVSKPSTEKRGLRPPMVFPTPDGTCWKDVQIEMVSRESLVVRLGNTTKRYHGFDMGFRDNRQVDMLNKQWDLLEAFAVNSGTLDWEAKGFKRPTQKRIEELNKLLCRFFRLTDNPIAPYKKKVGWVTKFQIIDSTFGKS